MEEPRKAEVLKFARCVYFKVVAWRLTSPGFLSIYVTSWLADREFDISWQPGSQHQQEDRPPHSCQLLSLQQDFLWEIWPAKLSVSVLELWAEFKLCGALWDNCSGGCAGKRARQPCLVIGESDCVVYYNTPYTTPTICHKLPGKTFPLSE